MQAGDLQLASPVSSRRCRRGRDGVVNSVDNLGGFFGPYMIGWLRDATGSFTAGLYALAGMLALAALSAPLIKLVRREPLSAVRT